MTLVMSSSARGAKWAITSEHCSFFQSCNSQQQISLKHNKTTHTHFVHSPYLIIRWNNCNGENTAALLRLSQKAHREVIQGERRDYGSVTSDFSLLLMIASIVWKASCGMCATHGYYMQTYYPWQKKWDEKREIMVRELLPQGGITHSLQESWFPSDFRRLRNASCALVVRRSPVTSPPSVCVCAYCMTGTCIVSTWVCVLAWLIYVCHTFPSIRHKLGL